MTVAVQPEQSAEAMHVRAGVLVGTLLGRYLEDPELLVAIANHAVNGWRAARDAGDLRDLDHWWDDHVGHVESAVGGADCATSDQLARFWAAYARRATANA